jgi:hypothetical protein
MSGTLTWGAGYFGTGHAFRAPSGGLESERAGTPASDGVRRWNAA